MIIQRTITISGLTNSQALQIKTDYGCVFLTFNHGHEFTLWFDNAPEMEDWSRNMLAECYRLNGVLVSAITNTY